MQFLTLVSLIAASSITGAVASSGARYPSVCGYWLVNNAGYTQSQIAEMKCGSTVTCGGQEWNTVFSMDLMGKWHAGSFCSTGCEERIVDGLDLARCH